MINTNKISDVIAGYKEYFPMHWENEKYKWIAVKHFQDNWDIDAPDFAAMLQRSLAKTENLLASTNNFPARMILAYAKHYPEEVRSAFENLYDESKDLADRIRSFKAKSDEWLKKTNDGAKQHYQNENTISTYLWLRYPEKYYIYKYSEAKEVVPVLESDHTIKKGKAEANVISTFALYDEMRAVLKADKEIRQMLDESLDAECYPDPELVTVTIDVGFYISRFYNKPSTEDILDTTEDIVDITESTKSTDTKVWLLTYNPSRWTWDDFNDVVEMTKRGEGYHTGWNCSNGNAKDGDRVFLAKLGDNKTPKGIFASGYVVSDYYEDDNFDPAKDNKIKYVEILLTEVLDYRTETIITVEELKQRFPDQQWSPQGSGIAIKPDAARWLIDNWNDFNRRKSTEPPKPMTEPVIWKISEGKNRNGVPEHLRSVLEDRKVVVVNQTTLPLASQKVSQGDSYMYEIKKGDYFYLCYASEIVLFGQFTDDEAVLNQEMVDEWDDYDWFERPYRIIANSIDRNKYTGKKKLWTSNYNSTCVKVNDNQLFEDLILKPYFDLTIADLKTENHCERYTKSDFLKEVFITEQQYNTLAALLDNKMNIILQGAPGVGKTFAARRLAWSIMGEKDDSRIEFIQFHQSYSYEDFIMGYRPDEFGGFELKEGVFYCFCDKARNDPDKKYFFIIDEINRGNLSKIFGELLMLIEKDYRKESARLAYRDENFSVPENLYIIGMMNTADRSLAMIDYALRRRFSFFDMSPGFDSDGFNNYQNRLENDTFNNLVNMIKLLNDDITKDGSLGKGFCIGHSHFCNLTKDTCTIDRLRSIVEYDIIPMLCEYWFDDSDSLNKWSANLKGIFNDD